MKTRVLFLIALILTICCFPMVYAEEGHSILSQGDIRMEDYNGLSIPVFTGEGWTEVPVQGYYFYQTKHAGGYIYIQSIDEIHLYGRAVGTEPDVRGYFKQTMMFYGDPTGRLIAQVTDQEDFPVLLLGSDDKSPHFFGTGSLVAYRYIRGKQEWKMTLGIFPEIGAANSSGESPIIKTDDLLQIAGMFSYDEADSEVGLKVSTKGGQTTMICGKKLQAVATFNNEGLVNKKEKNDGVLWSVRDENGNTPDGVAIDKKGVLSADPKKVQDVLNLTVQARSEAYLTRDTIQVRVVPRTEKIAADPAEVFFYVGTPASQILRAVLTPATVPADQLSWSIAKEGLVTLQAGEDGTAVVATSAEQKGKTAVTLKEAGGKSVKINVSVVDPVTDLELTAKGTPKQGGTVTIQGGLLPKNAGNKALEWSLDVDESIATVNAKGQVKIAKNAPQGTKITVTCKALGAPEPIVRTLEIVTE